MRFSDFPIEGFPLGWVLSVKVIVDAFEFHYGLFKRLLCFCLTNVAWSFHLYNNFFIKPTFFIYDNAFVDDHH